MNGHSSQSVESPAAGRAQVHDGVRRANSTVDAVDPLSWSRTTWLRTPGGRQVLVRVDEPVSGRARGALVIVPSIARESTVPFRRIRALAIRAADAGFVTLSLSLGGDGESQGLGFDDDLVRVWSDEVAATIEAAAEACPELPVNLVGWRLGGALAYAQIASDPPNPLVNGSVLLWEPASGTSFLRQHQNLRRFASTVTPLPHGVEVCGMHFTSDQARSLAALKVPRSLPDGSAFTVVREENPRDVMRLTLGSPHFVEVDVRLADSFVDRLRSGPSREYVPVPHVPEATWTEPGAGEVRETQVLVGEHRLPGVLTRSPGIGCTSAVVFTAIGAELRAGPGGTWTRAARELAPEGVVSLRMDRRYLGEDIDITMSREPYPYTEQSVRDVEEAADYLGAVAEASVTGVGACSGGWSLLRASAEGGFASVLAINPIHWDPDPRNYDEDFYERTYQAEGAFAQTLSVAASRDDEESPHPPPRPGWQMRIDPLLHRLARRFPRLRGFVRGDRRSDRVPALLELVPADTEAILAMGPGEAAVFRAKGGPGYIAKPRNAAHTRLIVDPAVDHSLFSAGSRNAVCELLRDQVAPRTTAP